MLHLFLIAKINTNQQICRLKENNENKRQNNGADTRLTIN